MSETQTPVERAIARVSGVYRRWNRNTGVEQMRQDWDDLFWSDFCAAAEERVSANGVPGLWVTAPGADADRAVLYLHGGGFRLGSSRSHRDLAARISAAGKCGVLLIDYRLAPEHLFPAPLEDTLAAYAFLLSEGFSPAKIAFAGDSAGGWLVASALLALRDRGETLPAAAVLLSAWTDLTATRASYETRAKSDPIHQRGMILVISKIYLGDTDPASPLASPLFAELHGLPPLLIQVGDCETVLDDSTDFAAKAQAAGVAVQLEVYDHMIHVFQQFGDDLPEAAKAIASIGAFLERHLA